jgi:hypothetical protein
MTWPGHLIIIYLLRSRYLHESISGGNIFADNPDTLTGFRFSIQSASKQTVLLLFAPQNACCLKDMRSEDY